MEKPQGTAPVLDLLTLRGQWLRYKPGTGALVLSPKRGGKERAGLLEGLCRDPCLDLPASLVVGLLPCVSWILDSQKLSGAEAAALLS